MQDANAQNGQGNTPLHYACLLGHTEVGLCARARAAMQCCRPAYIWGLLCRWCSGCWLTAAMLPSSIGALLEQFKLCLPVLCSQPDSGSGVQP